MSDYPDLDKLVEKCDYDTKLAITAWVFKHIVDHANSGGSYRHLIYDRLGFDFDAYVPLYEAGGMDITNEFDMKRMDEIKTAIRENKLEIMKKLVGMCDEPECFKDAGCGTPTNDTYRWTCYEHMPKEK